MTAVVTLRPGWATLADWRNVAHGAAVRLDPAAAPMVEASAMQSSPEDSRSMASTPDLESLRARSSGQVTLPRFSATSCYRMRLAWASQCNRQPYA
jgi:hypothetical protein